MTEFWFGDCAIVPNPNPEQLAEIAISSADSAKTFGIETPKKWRCFLILLEHLEAAKK